jgi:hypothetical protein
LFRGGRLAAGTPIARDSRFTSVRAPVPGYVATDVASCIRSFMSRGDGRSDGFLPDPDAVVIDARNIPVDPAMSMISVDRKTALLITAMSAGIREIYMTTWPSPLSWAWAPCRSGLVAPTD